MSTMYEPDEPEGFEAEYLRVFGQPQVVVTDEERAIQAIRDIQAGVNPALVSMKLANDFTDRQVARLKAWIFRP